MTDLPIAPDLTGDVPRCQTSCPHYVCHSARGPGTVCLPHVRHLKVLSERRCDGCANCVASFITAERSFCCEWGHSVRPTDDSCSRWVQRG